MKCLTIFFVIIGPVLTIFYSSNVRANNSNGSDVLNLGFEIMANGAPKGWSYSADGIYTITLDSVIKKSGKYSTAIRYNTGKPNFKACSMIIPRSYQGRQITLKGFIKTENVVDGYAGLWLRLDPSVAFDNMYNKGVKGTTDWQEYEITLPMNPEKTQQIVFGGLLVGKGTMWLDDLKILIDGIDIGNAQLFEKKLFPADMDKEFDNGSHLSSIPADSVTVQRLKTLGLIWGFTKYYHPAIARGEFHWDYELFRVLPEVLAAKNNSAYHTILIRWLGKLGRCDPDTTVIKHPNSIKLQPDLHWIEQSGFPSELTTTLLSFIRAKRPTRHYYIGTQPGVGNPEFKNEQPYPNKPYPDAGFRLLAVYRYWNIIQYFFPYKNLIDKDWKNTLAEYIPAMINATSEKEYALTMLELTAQIYDTHAYMSPTLALNAHFGRYVAAPKLTFIEQKPVVTGFYNDIIGKRSGIMVGDILTSVNNKPVDEFIKEQAKFFPASNIPVQLRNIAQKLLQSNDSTITVEYHRAGKHYTALIPTYSRHELGLDQPQQSKDTCFRLLNDSIAYIHHGLLKVRYLPELWNTIRQTRGMIIDLRNYPSDFPIYSFSAYLMPESKQFVKFSNVNIQRPGLFTFGDPITVGYNNNGDSYKGKIIILVNENTQSSAEFHAMAYRAHPNAVVIGSTTAGADGNVSKILLPGGLTTMISGIGVYYPDGRETQRVGIVPDLEVRPTIRGVFQGKDEVLDKALFILQGGVAR